MMTPPQMLIFAVITAMLLLFFWGRLRHDVVAFAALMACVVAGLVPASDAFNGFSHPAVFTVACVLILSKGLQDTGAVDWLARRTIPREAGRFTSMAALLGLGAALSGFMNNVGAMALLMPIAIQVSHRLNLTQGQVLMPLAFGTILGGMTTLIGTPPNLIVSSFRNDAGLGHFSMFDFTPVGLAVAAVGVVFIFVIGWRLVPAREATSGESFDPGAYVTEVRIPANSKAIGLTLRGFEDEIEDSHAVVVGLLRNDVRMMAPHGGRRIKENDILVLEAEVDALAEALAVFDIKLEEKGSVADQEPDGEDDATPQSDADQKPEAAKKSSLPATLEKLRPGQQKDTQADSDKRRSDDDIVLRELAVLPGSTIVDHSATDIALRRRFGLNMLAVGREGRPPHTRLRQLKLKSGDLLLMHGPSDALFEFVKETGCVPLGERALHMPDTRLAILSVVILLGAVVTTATGLLPAAAAFGLGVLATMLVRTVPLRQLYTSIDWPVIVLLAALIPIAGAMQDTGAADILARFLLDTVAQGNAIAALVVFMVTTMFLSDVMNNAATAAVLCPIALGIANTLGVNADSFFMAVAIGASCAFLTPIGHQNATLILGPGGFRFGDYWRLGLPLEMLVVAVSVPALLVVWPL
ncbi:SLC13 family permease [Roseibaca sp. V10]|uniref:SLC13 family permease n=1 Tax=Roseinatronobacter domitianus TaxID=2940293 RepID=A0ABT0M293_9RHOB|nr:SLC13 family permease [Roseibaca domitiana]MCL1628961.1 SLC13 family permease [Roseibaca domitiana]